MPDLLKEIEQKQAELKRLEDLVKKYPDIRKDTDRWQRVRFASKSVNHLVTDVEISHGCGCCDDSPLYARPFVEINGERLYSDPFLFYVGDKNYGNGEREDYGWEKRLIEQNINQMVIDKIRSYLDACKPEEDEETDEN